MMGMELIMTRLRTGLDVYEEFRVDDKRRVLGVCEIGKNMLRKSILMTAVRQAEYGSTDAGSWHVEEKEAWKNVRWRF
jgi:hypothetical protein